MKAFSLYSVHNEMLVHNVSVNDKKKTSLTTLKKSTPKQTNSNSQAHRSLLHQVQVTPNSEALEVMQRVTDICRNILKTVRSLFIQNSCIESYNCYMFILSLPKFSCYSQTSHKEQEALRIIHNIICKVLIC